MPVNATQPVWQPSPERIAASNLTRFHAACRGRGAPPEADYAALWRWSVDRREDFWEAVAEFTGVVWERGQGPVTRHRDRMPGCQWFDGSRLNFAENLLARRDEHPALVFTNERGARRELSYRELHGEVARIAA